MLLADDHFPTRDRLRSILEASGFDVCASVADADAAVQEAVRLRPDVCVLDVRMPGSGIGAAKRIAAGAPAAVILMLTVSREDADLIDALEAGASGYVLKDADPDLLPGLLRRALDGEAVLSGPLAARLVEELRGRGRRRRLLGPHRQTVELTPREWQVLELLADYLTTEEVAERLFVEPGTVRTHVASILRKLQVPSREAALRLLQQHSGRQLEE